MSSSKTWTVVAGKRAEKVVARAPRLDQERLRAALKEMGSDPFTGDIERLKDDSPSIAACRANLLGKGQWLQELRQRTGDPRYYLHFAKLCQEETEHLIWTDKAEQIVWTGDPFEPSLPPDKRI